MFILDSNEIASAWSYMATVYETQDQVTSNYNILKQIADYCKANGITIQVNAVLTNPAQYSDGTNALVGQWAGIAASVGLPISRVQDVNETATVNPDTSTLEDFAATATVEVNAVRTLLNAYANSSYQLTAGNLQVGDMEGGAPASSRAWWIEYNMVARSNGLSGFSFWTTDLNQYGPWSDPLSTAGWQATLESMSQVAAAGDLATNVLVQGADIDQTGNQFVAQAEQNAADIAMLVAAGSISVNSIELQSWASLPVGVGLITSPTSTANEAVEIAATFSLYAAGAITASGSASINAPNQLVIPTGNAQSIGQLGINWSAQDVANGGRLAVVLVDQTGTLTARSHGSGTATNNNGNVLILNGTSADLAAELASVMVAEPYAGPDTLDIEVFGMQGRLTDAQISMLAGVPGQATATLATNSSQGWLSASATLNTGTVLASDAIMTHETVYWNTAPTSGTTVPGQSAFLNVVAIHEPLAEYGVKNTSSIVLGTTANAVVDIFDSTVDWAPYTANGYANNAGKNNAVSPQTTGWLKTAFNASAAVTPMVVQSTVNSFDPNTGRLLSSINNLAPDPLTTVDLTGAHANPFATAFSNGGTQVVEYNTGNNPGWNIGWGTQFNAATLTYDGSGHLVELFLQGGAADPWFTVDNVFNPNTGELWEQFETAAPPPASSDGQTYLGTQNQYKPGFVSGPLFITQFRTGNNPSATVNNPNWNYLDWGASSTVDTEVWTDYFMMANFSGFALNYAGLSAGDINNYPRQFVNGTTLDLFYLPGSIAVDLNALGTVTIASQVLASSLTGLNAIDAAGATGTVTITGLMAGSSALIGGNTASTIKGYGHDTIVAGTGQTSIDTGSGSSVVHVAYANSSASITGNNNTIDAAAGDTLTIAGTGNVVSGSSVTLTVTSPGAVLTESGQSNTVQFAGGGGTLVETGSTSKTALYGSYVAAWLEDGATLTATGSHNVIVGKRRLSITLTGDASTVQAADGSTITLGGANDTVEGSGLAISASPGTANLLIEGSSDNISAATGSSLAVQGAQHTITASGVAVQMLDASSTMTLFGNSNTIYGCAGSWVAIGSGSNNVVSGSGTHIIVANPTNLLIEGSNDSVTAAPGSSLAVRGAQHTIVASGVTIQLLDASSGVNVFGDNDTVYGCSGSSVLIGSGSNNVVSGTSTNVIVNSNNPVSIQGSNNNTVPLSTATNSFFVYDTSNGTAWQAASQAYNGPVAGLTSEIIIPTTDSINVTAEMPNVFIHTGSGMDGIKVTSGNNILDGSTNSNFLIGGSGHDAFYMDDRTPDTPIFSTIVNFHSGDDAAVWGVDQADFNMIVLDNQGAPGATGVDLIFTAPGHVAASFVLAGYSSADLTNGRLSMAYGRTQDLPGLPGSLYLTVHAN